MLLVVLLIKIGQIAKIVKEQSNFQSTLKNGGACSDFKNINTNVYQHVNQTN